MFNGYFEKRRLKRFHRHLRDHEKVETNFEFWMEHVVHWHLLLFAVAVALSFGYVLVTQDVAMAGLTSVYPQ